MRSERAQTTVEYVGLLIVLGLVALVLMTKGPGIASALATQIEHAICVVAGDCEAEGGEATGPGQLPGSDVTGALPPGAGPAVGEGPSAPVPPGFSVGAGAGAAAADPTATQADPVNSLTGAFETAVADARLPAPAIPFAFTRTYTSDPTVLTDPGPLGPGWTHPYAARIVALHNDAVEVVSADGQRIRYQHQRGSFSAHPGVRARLYARGGGYELRLPGGVSQRFDAAGRLREIADRNANRIGLSYAGGLLAEIRDAARRRIELSSDDTGRLTELRLPDGRTVAYAYDDAGRLVEVTDLRGGRTTYSYDDDDRITAIRNQAGELVVANEYGADGRITAQTDALENRSTFAWEAGAAPGSGTQTMTDAVGGRWSDTYERGALVARTDPEGRTSAYSWDDALRLIRATDPAGASWSLAYDQRSNPVRAEGPESEVWRAAYNGLDLPTRISGPAGRRWTADYDRAGNLIAVTDSAGSTTSAAYDHRGLPIRVADPLGNTAELGWDRRGALASATTPSGRRYTFAYDRDGRLIRATDPAGESYRYGWSAADQLVRASDPLGNATELAYDEAGRLTSATDAKGRTASWAYDEAGHLTSVTTPDGTATSYAYDPAGRLGRITDPLGGESSFAYDPAGRPVAARGPEGEVVTAAYDRAGRLAEVISAAGNATEAEGDGTITFAYDALGRIAGVDYSDADTADVRLAYDPAGALSSIAAGESEERYRYDEAGRLIRASLDGESFAYAYDAAGRMTARTAPSGEPTRYSHDPDGRLASAETPVGPVSYAYDAAGRLARSTLPNGARTHLGHDAAGRVTQVRHLEPAGEVIAELAYSYDATGNPSRVASDEGRVLYAYDERDRLAGACLAAPCAEGDRDLATYSYDPLGNILTSTSGAETTSYDYDASSRIESSSGSDGEVTYEHDPDGNLTRAGGRTYGYDQAGRLTAVAESGADLAAYAYDAAGRRTSAVYPGAAEGASPGAGGLEWLWDPGFALPQLAEERTAEGKLLRRYSYAAGRVAQEQGGATSYFHPDRLGSAIALSGEDGKRSARTEFGPYGAAVSGDAATGKAETPFAFTGEYLDQATGLYHLRARDYDPTSARFLAVDPIPAPVGAPARSPYAYVGGRPTAFTDPSGMLPDLTPQFVDDAAQTFDDNVLDPAGDGIAGGAQAFDDNVLDPVGNTAEDIYTFAGEHADEAALGIGLVGLGVCTFATAGACAAVAGPAMYAGLSSSAFSAGYQSGVIGPGEADYGALAGGLAMTAGGYAIGTGFSAIRFFHKPAGTIFGSLPALSTTRAGSVVAPQIPAQGMPGFRAYAAGISMPDVSIRGGLYLLGQGDDAAGAIGEHDGK